MRMENLCRIRLPLVHWAVIESTPGGLKAMGELGAKLIAPQTANPNIIHTMELYANPSAYQKYAESETYKLFLRQTENMFISAHEVDNLPTKIILSTKGLKVS